MRLPDNRNPGKYGQQRVRHGAAAEPPSQREPELLELAAAGSASREAAAKPFTSAATVKARLLPIYAKLNVGGRAADVQYCHYPAKERGAVPDR
jgi:ATP/maltotriose-dependent transcriptional regulator MalT